MDRESLVNELKVFLEDFLRSRNLDLVDLIHRYEGRDLVLRILLDKPEGGISLGECAGLNREISDLLDAKNILQEKYVLEVSSPGLDRPLKREKDFLRCLDKKVKFFLNELINGKLEWDGTITGVKAGIVYINTPAGAMEVPLAKINKAKRII
ncbi:MAG: ribosome maturation factor RimP [Candidatus Omnitrophica bacterium]|nr:ribosome maturation factor RimP [Candidatus Omnitrophota bacterium]MDD5027513.1 ribosome maturation factor RimP [Candidatus Omnitrophota bacterium]MDD5662320.1 ribosome maturation factor RimP [Candidatus Omnitrophota bacterium]